MRAFLKRFGPELYDMATTPLSLKVRMLKADVIYAREHRDHHP